MALPQSPRCQLWFDGSAKVNPGPMGIGYVLKQEGVVIAAAGAGIGPGTNNLAEYYALVLGLRHALRLGRYDLEVFSDSQLIVNQVLGRFKMKQKGRFKRVFGEAMHLVGLFTSFSINHVYRDKNGEADALSRTVHFEEITMPPLKRVKGRLRVLRDYQAAAIRDFWANGFRNPHVLGRIYNVIPQTVDGIVNGRSYRKSDHSDIPAMPFAGLPLLALPPLAESGDRGIGGSIPGSVLLADEPEGV